LRLKSLGVAITSGPHLCNKEGIVRRPFVPLYV
jgi:hypothetical protein